MLNRLKRLFEKARRVINIIEENYSGICMTLTSFRINGSVININLEYYDCCKINYAVLKSRSTGDFYKFDIKKKTKGAKTIISFCIEIGKIEWHEFYWDFYLEDEHQNLIRINNPNLKTHTLISRTRMFSYKFDNKKILYPFFHESKSLSLIYRLEEEYDDRKYRINEILARLLYLAFKWYFDSRRNWMVFEKRSETAQDNAFYFFKYCVDEKKIKNIYFVIKRESNDGERLEKYRKNIVYFMSIRHLILIQSCKLIISSEAKGHGYIWRANRGIYLKILNQKKQVFLQHGVLGLKKVGEIFNSSITSSNKVELFVASSEYEKELIINNFGYNSNQVILTGLPRWDHLIDKSDNYKEILCMPTFRNWLEEVDEKEFLKSSYFKEYQNLINSKELHLLLDKYNYKFFFCLHPKNIRYVSCFSTTSNNVEIVSPNSIHINELIMRSSLLVTDYSSVAWDMLYLKKAILFYHFDLEEYIKHQGSYLNLRNKIFSNVVYNKSELIKWIDLNISSKFYEKRLLSVDEGIDLKYRDNNNCKRVYLEIIKNRQLLEKSSLFIKMKQNELLYECWRIAQLARRRMK